MTLLQNLARHGARLRRDLSGISMVEFALTLPVLLTLGLYGTEVARLAISRTLVSQVALSLADNASRLGQTDNSGVSPTITESDVSAILGGAIKQGEQIDLQNNGRIILTSLEGDAYTGKQFIHWQRCIGNLNRSSAYGNQGANNGLTGTPITGMGSGSQKVTAPIGSAVMFVEIYYTYQPLFENPFGSGTLNLKQEAAFIIRDDRNLLDSSVDGLSGANVNTC